MFIQFCVCIYVCVCFGLFLYSVVCVYIYIYTYTRNWIKNKPKHTHYIYIWDREGVRKRNFCMWLVSLFNGISTFMGYLIPDSSLNKNSHREIRECILFPSVFVWKRICDIIDTGVIIYRLSYMYADICRHMSICMYVCTGEYIYVWLWVDLRCVYLYFMRGGH